MKEEIYIGEIIRAEIKKQQVKNGFVINKLVEAGIGISDATFSNKIYGERDTFTAAEIAVIKKALKIKSI